MKRALRRLFLKLPAFWRPTGPHTGTSQKLSAPTGSSEKEPQRHKAMVAVSHLKYQRYGKSVSSHLGGVCQPQKMLANRQKNPGFFFCVTLDMMIATMEFSIHTGIAL